MRLAARCICAFNDLDDPAPIPRDTDYASVFESDVPIIVQHTRLDSRHAEVSLLSTVALSGRLTRCSHLFIDAAVEHRELFALHHVCIRAGSLWRRNMKIAQIAPLMESVPPRLYGGSERIVSYLTDELVRQGHDVTLFASGDSVSSADLVRCVPMALRLDANVRDPIPYYMLMLDRVRELADEFDILHFHIDQFHFPLFRPIANRTVTTLHGRQDLHDLKPLYVGFSDMPLVSISNAQRKPIANANFAATVYHGLPHQTLQADLQAERRLCRVSRPHLAGEAAGPRHPDRPGARDADQDRGQDRQGRRSLFPRNTSRRCSTCPASNIIGEIDERSKSEFLGEASALLFPIDWPEPFGLSMIEAMACGTPVLAFRCGSVPEIVDPGVTGADRRYHGRGDAGVAAGACARSPRGAAEVRTAILGGAHGQGLCPGVSFADQESGAAGTGRPGIEAPAGA